LDVNGEASGRSDVCSPWNDGAEYEGSLAVITDSVSSKEEKLFPGGEYNESFIIVLGLPVPKGE